MKTSDFIFMGKGTRLKVLSKSIYPIYGKELLKIFPNYEGRFAYIKGDGLGTDESNCIVVGSPLMYDDKRLYSFAPYDLELYEETKLKTTIYNRPLRMVDRNIDCIKIHRKEPCNNRFHKLNNGFHEWEEGNLFELINEKLVSSDTTYTEYQNFAKVIWSAAQLHLKNEV